MGTRSRIAVMHGGKCKSVYCHWDGYFEHNGKILLENYDSTKANFLVALGDISSLRPNIGEAHPFSEFDIKEDDPDFDQLIALHEQAEAEGWTTFYGRDRGEKTKWQVSDTFEEFLDLCDSSCAEYYYVMEDGVWYAGSMYGDFKHRLVRLDQVLEKVLAE